MLQIVATAASSQALADAPIRFLQLPAKQLMMSLHKILPALLALALSSAALAATERQTLQHQGLQRSYVLRLPPQVQAGARLPLVLVLHGGAGNAEHAERMTGFTDKGAREGFIVVYPEGSGRLKDRLLTWNAGHCCGSAMQGQVDDVGFIRALIDALVARYPVDPARIYVTGMSNGGMMTHRLGLALGDRLAAIAPVVATVFGDEPRAASPLPALMINGAQDVSVPPAGGAPGGRFPQAWDGTPTQPALAQARLWAQANGCQAEAQRSESSVAIQWRHACPVGREVELLLVKDVGHAWPGDEAGSRRGDAPGKALDATTVIWDFFKAHHR
jgi:polyhydroxybutyrate depolymerase